MNTTVKRSSRQKAPRAKPTSTYLGPDDERRFEFIMACTNEKIRLSGDENAEAVSRAEMIRILIEEKAEALEVEGWKAEQFSLPL